MHRGGLKGKCADFLMKTLEAKFEIIINVLVISFWLIYIPMLWVYGHYTYFYSYSAVIDFSRQNLTSTDVRFWRLKSSSQPVVFVFDWRVHGFLTRFPFYRNLRYLCFVFR